MTTNDNYCIGSKLALRSLHAIANIVWYRNGTPVHTAQGSQSLSTTGVTVAGGVPLSGDNSQVVYCTGICVDSVGNLYTADNIHQWVKKYKPGNTSGVIVAGGNGTGSADNQLHNPESIALDRQGHLFIYDAGNDRIQQWTPGAASGTTVTYTSGGSYAGLGYGLYIDCMGYLYFDDVEQQAVEKLPPSDADDAQIVAGNHSEGPNPNQFNVPGDISVDNNGNIFVVDMYNYRIQKWAPGASSGTTVAGNGMRGLASNQLTVVNAWVDGQDTLYISDAGDGLGNTRVLKWAPGATSGQLLLGGNGVGSAPNQFNGNGPIAMDLKGNFYVSDGGNYRIQEFIRTTVIDSTFSPTDPGIYYAVATDIQGFTATSNTVYINSPGQPPATVAITATATSTPVCTPITFTAATDNGGSDPQLQWQVSGVNAGDGTPTYSDNLFANGDQVYCILTTPTGCSGGLEHDTSNIVTLAIDPQGAAAMTIDASRTAVCKGDVVSFAATVTNGSATPVFQWLVNGIPVDGDVGASYQSDTLTTGDVITCKMTSDDVCGLAKSNSIPVIVSIPPVIAANQVYTIPYGQTLEITPSVTGDVASWLWTPGAGLSDSTIGDPIASPSSNTVYTLVVTAPDGGCSDTATILVKVLIPMGIPNAFTPNNDGHNDVFYVLGGPPGSSVEDIWVFNRWGAAVFHAHDVMPGDRSTGWNGNFHGSPAPAGAYVYEVVMKLANGSLQPLKGTVILVR